MTKHAIKDTNIYTCNNYNKLFISKQNLTLHIKNELGTTNKNI